MFWRRTKLHLVGFNLSVKSELIQEFIIMGIWWIQESIKLRCISGNIAFEGAHLLSSLDWICGEKNGTSSIPHSS